jgi:hypothetical protein
MKIIRCGQTLMHARTNVPLLFSDYAKNPMPVSEAMAEEVVERFADGEIIEAFYQAGAELYRDTGQRPGIFLAGRNVLINVEAMKRHGKDWYMRTAFEYGMPDPSGGTWVIGFERSPVALDPYHPWRVTAVLPGVESLGIEKHAYVELNPARDLIVEARSIDQLALTLADREQWDAAMRRGKTPGKALRDVWDKLTPADREQIEAGGVLIRR